MVVKTFDRELTYILKSTGPRTEPWGTPNDNITLSDKSSPVLTRCERCIVRWGKKSSVDYWGKKSSLIFQVYSLSIKLWN